MAEAAVTFLLDNVQKLLVEQMHLISGAEKELKQLQIELELMNAFLMEYADKREKGQVFIQFERQIREAVYEVKEETGLEISGVEILTITNNVIMEPRAMHLVAVMMRAALAHPNQQPLNVEPLKCDGWDWYDWDHLPTPLLLTLQTAILGGLNPFPPNY